jgi:hypothetical protein
MLVLGGRTASCPLFMSTVLVRFLLLASFSFRLSLFLFFSFVVSSHLVVLTGSFVVRLVRIPEPKLLSPFHALAMASEVVLHDLDPFAGILLPVHGSASERGADLAHFFSATERSSRGGRTASCPLFMSAVR